MVWHDKWSLLSASLFEIVDSADNAVYWSNRVFIVLRVYIVLNDKYKKLRASPWEHQAGLLHAISPISMKLCQFKGSTPKLEKTNWFVFWIFQGGDRPPPSIYYTFTIEIAWNWAKYMKLSIQLYLTYCFESVYTYWYILSEGKGTSVNKFDWPLVNQPRQISERVVRHFETFKYLTISRSNIFRFQRASTIIFMSLCSILFRLLTTSKTFLGTPIFLVQMRLIIST